MASRTMNKSHHKGLLYTISNEPQFRDEQDTQPLDILAGHM